MVGSIREQMEALLGEVDVEADVGEGEETEEVDMKALVPQLVLAAKAIGLDPSEEDQLEVFLKTLKKVAMKEAMLKAAIRRFTPARAAKAVKTAKQATTR